MLERTPTSQTRHLADFAATTELASVPAATRARLKECLLDTIGVAAFSAQFAESSPAFRNGVLAMGYGPGDATVIGEARTYAPMQAALLNGAFAHTLDFDDTNVWGYLHPGAPVIAAALVEAERLRSSGAELLEALAVGYEVACRVGAALGQTAYDRGFHITSVAGIFGGVAAAGRLRRIDGATIASAFGVAGSSAAGSMQYLSNGSWNKRLHPGLAAHAALLSLGLAQAGVLGAEAAIDGQYGLLAGYTDKPNAALLTERLGTWWPSTNTALKPFPSCRLTHTAAEAALLLRERATEGQRRNARLRVRLSPKAVQIVGEPLPNKIKPANIVEGQFSVYFQVAVSWLDGRCNWQSYERLGASDVDTFASTIEVVADDNLAMAAAELTDTVHPSLTLRIDDPLGESNRPLDPDHVHRKFRDLAMPVYGKERVKRIVERVAALEEEPDAAVLIHLLRAESGS
ncbi:MmgE/PrpD family protein [Bradyrhizobium prioriisuperbiae]|uniref:MmgE/PrpD family protein n=1 Tax=Bradyrhizobium prioriisuperbiae TaxID=2854389 RepID=UPI0028E40091|nr:MmgE/PrpD family protein [Bradyrhizobium prioritasuperba]